MENIIEFQFRVHDFVIACFDPDIAYDKVERNHRFLEEALELVQSIGCTKEEALLLVDYVYGRPAGETNQEIGGVMVTLAALCNAGSHNMNKAGETELERVWKKIDKIREKQLNKPRNSPLPAQPEQSFSREDVEELRKLAKRAVFLCEEYAQYLTEAGGNIDAQVKDLQSVKDELKLYDQKLNTH